MATRYTQHIAKTPQTRPAFGRTDMVKNNAGGYGFSITPQQRLERFLMIGAEGGTYYVSEKTLTVDNAKAILEYIKTDGIIVANTAMNSIRYNLAPKVDPALFVLALCMTYGSADVKKHTYPIIPIACRTATQLFTLIGFINDLRGWSRGLRTNVARWYTNKTPDQVAYQMVKYRQRNGYTHKDVLRLSHPKSATLNDLFKYAVGKSTGVTGNPLITAFEAAMKATTDNELVRLITDNKLTWEMIPTEKLNNALVLDALLPNMPLTATIRNLNRFANSGLTEGNSKAARLIEARLTDKEVLKKAHMHPVNIVNSLLVYSRGHGFKGGQTWTPNQRIVDALTEAFYLAIDAMPKSNKEILVGVDSSGSMNSGQVNGTALSPNQFANVLALTMLKSEPNAHVMAFDTKAYEVRFGKRSSLDEVLRMPSPGGGTDCSLPLRYAITKRLKLDGIVILTDNESWAGDQHSFEILTDYRAKLNTEVKMVEVALTATGHSQFPSDDRNLMRVVGFDSSVLNLIGMFLGQVPLEDEVA